MVQANSQMNAAFCVPNILLGVLVIEIMALGGRTALTADTGAGHHNDVQVTASLKTLTPTNCIIEFSLLNNRSKNINIFARDLPWGADDALILVPVVLTSEETRLTKVFRINDPPPVIVTIQKFTTRKGDVWLNSRFPELLKALKKSEVIVFWSYQCKPEGEEPVGRINGHVTIPKLMP